MKLTPGFCILLECIFIILALTAASTNDSSSDNAADIVNANSSNTNDNADKNKNNKDDKQANTTAAAANEVHENSNNQQKIENAVADTNSSIRLADMNHSHSNLSAANGKIDDLSHHSVSRHAAGNGAANKSNTNDSNNMAVAISVEDQQSNNKVNGNKTAGTIVQYRDSSGGIEGGLGVFIFVLIFILLNKYLRNRK